MPRWETDGRERLEAAALDLFLEIGFEATTVSAIARRAGLTERSFYRHFTDKREVLFTHESVLIDHIVRKLRDALQDQPAYPAVIAAISAADEVFLPRETLRRRTEAINRSVALTERERSKLASLSDAIADTLREGGSTARESRILADLALSILLIASGDRLVDRTTFRELVRRAADDQREIVTNAAPINVHE